jgi:hypothetical protein
VSPFPIFPGAQGAHGAIVPIGFTKLTTAGSFSFTNIPQIYQDLMLVINAQSNFPLMNAGFSMQFNGDGGSNYSYTFLNGDGAVASSGRGTNSNITIETGVPGSLAPPYVFGSATNHIINYKASAFKAVISRSSQDMNGSGITRLSVNQWRNTSPITSLIGFTSGAFIPSSTATLYGVRSVGQ